MTRTRISTAAAAALVLAATGLWFYERAEGSEAPPYRLAAVERGNLEAAVSATGTLGAVTTVQVGTQVSGQVSAIYVDFNDRVKKGQLIARIDPTLQQQAVQDAQAGLDRARAQYEQARQEYERNKQLFEAKIVTASEFGSVQSNYQVAQANVKSAQVTLDRARQNLAYTSIYAPIDGVVVERNVDVGQTVAASLSAPQLFLIANDLSRMQILASVDESDIGLIREGGTARFTVQAYPNETFTGTVRQVRLQSTTKENVVNYTAVVEVENPNGKLLPGMTATVSFLTGSATNVLMVPNAALRFRPTAEMLADADVRQPAQGGARADSSRALNVAQSGGGAARTGTGGSSGAGARRSGNAGTLWYLGASGKLTSARVRTGLTDGQKTEITGTGIAEGTQVVVGVSQGAQAASGAAASPFQQQSQGGGPPRPGGF
jgi:HlyD family secretion protein